MQYHYNTTLRQHYFLLQLIVRHLDEEMFVKFSLNKIDKNIDFDMKSCVWVSSSRLVI
jgi:hypothetical protein